LKGKTISGYQFNASNANLVGVPAESLYVHLFTEAPGCVVLIVLSHSLA